MTAELRAAQPLNHPHVRGDLEAALDNFNVPGSNTEAASRTVQMFVP